MRTVLLNADGQIEFDVVTIENLVDDSPFSSWGDQASVLRYASWCFARSPESTPDGLLDIDTEMDLDLLI